MQFAAAILYETGGPLAIERVQIGELKTSDVLVKVHASGLCHTDLEVIRGTLKAPLPIVLGHEGAGVVEAVGHDHVHLGGLRRLDGAHHRGAGLNADSAHRVGLARQRAHARRHVAGLGGVGRPHLRTGRRRDGLRVLVGLVVLVVVVIVYKEVFFLNSLVYIISYYLVFFRL